MAIHSVTTTTTMTVIGTSTPLAAQDLAHAVGADTAWVVQLVETGIVQQISTPDAAPERWQFESNALQCALEARRLERDFGVGLDAAALILDLQHEVRRLKSLLGARGR